MTQILLFYQGRSYLLETIPSEYSDEAYQRLWRIIQHQPTNQYMFEQLERISRMWYYKQRFNCRYSTYNEQLISMFLGERSSPIAQMSSKIGCGNAVLK